MDGLRWLAHTTFPGLGEYASGFLHPFTTPAHLLILLALGLWLGQRAPLRVKEPAAAFAAAAAIGLALTTARPGATVNPAVLSVLGLIVGGCIVLALPTPLWVKLIVCAIAALTLGLDSGADAATPPGSAVKTLVANWAALVLCVVNAAFYVSLLPTARPAQIGVRVVGSWIVAVAVLLLAFAWRR